MLTREFQLHVTMVNRFTCLFPDRTAMSDSLKTKRRDVEKKEKSALHDNQETVTGMKKVKLFQLSQAIVSNISSQLQDIDYFFKLGNYASLQNVTCCSQDLPDVCSFISQSNGIHKV